MSEEIPQVIQGLLQYLDAVDQIILKLSHMQERYLSHLPGWILSKKEVKFGVTASMGIVIKIIPTATLEQNKVTQFSLANLRDAQNILQPFQINSLPTFNEPLFCLGGLTLTGQDKFSAPLFMDDGLAIFGGIKELGEMFNLAIAQRDALNFWNQATNFKKKVNAQLNYIQETQKILSKGHAMIKERSFKERRIHRYLDAHAGVLLPSHVNHYFDHALYFNDGTKETYRKADFILEQEFATPSILVELEGTTRKVLTKNGDLAADLTHARDQIQEWVAIINDNPERNASGDFAFLRGVKTRLIIIGRGEHHSPKLLALKHDNIIVWTYDILFKEACARLNKDYATKCEILGLPTMQPFKI